MTPLRDRLARPVGWRGFAWRGAAFGLVFLCGFAALEAGVGVSERAAVAGGDVWSHLYYALGLFVFAGLDLGVPSGGSAFARGVLWVAYFAAPALTASAVVEGVLRAIGPGYRRWQHREGHVVVLGYGRLASHLIAGVRARDRRTPIVVVDRREHHSARLAEARALHRLHVVHADATEPGLLERVGAPRAAQVLFLTGSDFANLEAATRLLELDASAGARSVVHVGDLGLRRALEATRVGRECAVFNRHEAAARQLVSTRLKARFEETKAPDAVVLGGFGRFGQTVLWELQRQAAGLFDTVVLVDVDAQRNADEFASAIGFGDYRREVLDGDLADPRVWQRVVEGPAFDGRAPVVVAATGDDGLNLRLALRVKERRPSAYVVARTFHHSAFADAVGADRDIKTFSLAELVEEAITPG